MMRDTSGMWVVLESIRVALSIDSLVVMPDDRRDLGVFVDVGQDALSDRRMFLHLATLVESESTRFLQEPRR